MLSSLISGGEESFVVGEHPSKLSRSHVEDVLIYGQVDDLLEALSSCPCVDIQGPERRQIGLNVARVPKPPELDECGGRFLWVLVFLRDGCLIVDPSVDLPNGATTILVPILSLISKEDTNPGDLLPSRCLGIERGELLHRFPPRPERCLGIAVEFLWVFSLQPCRGWALGLLPLVLLGGGHGFSQSFGRSPRLPCLLWTQLM